jgi:hypothetical protein
MGRVHGRHHLLAVQGRVTTTRLLGEIARKNVSATDPPSTDATDPGVVVTSAGAAVRPLPRFAP